jgi:hypothetical protein
MIILCTLAVLMLGLSWAIIKEKNNSKNGKK